VLEDFFSTERVGFKIDNDFNFDSDFEELEEFIDLELENL
jgi:hypothetical protein